MIAQILQAVAGTIHGGALVAFALLLNFRHAMRNVRDEDVVRVYRSFGSGFGLSLGVLVFSSAWLYATRVNPGKGLPDAFAVHFDDPLTVARLALFFVVWVSYTVLEVWTLEPCRQLDKGTIADPEAYATATNRVARQLGFNALLFTIVVALGAAGAAP